MNPQFSETLECNDSTQSPENLAPPVDPAITDPIVTFSDGQHVTNVPTLDGIHLPTLERCGSPLSLEDVQAAKRGRTNAEAADYDALKSMEVDDQSDSLSEGGCWWCSYHDHPSSDLCESCCGVAFSERVHARIDFSMRRSLIIRLLGRSIGYKTLLAKVKVLWQPQGAFQGLSTVGGNAGEGVDAAEVTDQNCPMSTEDTVYGPWMVAGSRRRQVRKDIHSHGFQPSGNRFCGSRFNIMNEFDSTDVTPGNVDEIDRPNGASILDIGHRVVGVIDRPSGVQPTSRPVENPVMGATISDDIRKVSGGGVITHEVQNVAGNHAAVSILDVANEKRRQRLALSGGTRSDVQSPIVKLVVPVEAMVHLASHLGNGLDVVNRS
ncbi:hypothetical protein V6N12_045738 [Hibiscus sabdariffa]|uniref:Uncharacterized protein n=1 Tax=Hibiscus sabdariffa TaxID=183260 RepID=A0ABR2G3L0_9ROSI